MTMRLALHWQILLAILLAALAGSWSGTEGTLFGVRLYAVYGFIGTLFLNALLMIIVPLITASIITAVAGIGTGEHLGRLGLKTILFYTFSSLAAILVGLILVNLIAPGVSNGEAVGEQLNLSRDDEQLSSVLQQVGDRDAGDIAAVFIRMIPPNVIAAAAEGQMLGLIFFSLLFGFFMTRLQGEPGRILLGFWQGVFDVMLAMTLLVMRFAPIGVFGLVAQTVAATGFAAFQPLLWFFLTTALALLLHAFVVLPLALRWIGRVRPGAHIKAMSPAILTAFSTASSAATLPLTLECVEKNAGVSNRTSGFVLPLGATINMDGTALYECVAAIFIAQAYGLDLTLGQQFLIVVVALLTSIGVAGIPAASLVAIAIILTTIGLPLEGLGLLLVTDRILDMMRTAVNIFSDSCGAVIIARSEGEATRVGV